MALTSSQPVVLNPDQLLRKAAVAAVQLNTQALDEDCRVNAADGITLQAGDRVLLVGQADPEENGIYLVPSDGLLGGDRAADANADAEFNESWIVRCTAGTVYAGKDWVYQYFGASVTLDTTELYFRSAAGTPEVLTP